MRFLIGSSCCLLRLTLLAFLFSSAEQFTTYAQVLGQGNSNMTIPFQRVEAAARAATANDTDSINELTNAVLDEPHVFQLPSPVRTLLAAKAANAEIRYRNGQQKGITETQIVDLMNRIGKTLKIPDESRVTLPQLRRVRMGLAIEYPAFMGKGLSTKGMKSGDTVIEIVSPLQALHIIFTLTDQKVADDDFSDPVTDPRILIQRRKQEMSAFHQSNQRGQVVMRSNPKATAFRRAVVASCDGMSFDDAVKITSDAVKSLGLQ